MQMTKEALSLFIQSLPKGSYFDIISFGTKFFSIGKKKKAIINSEVNTKNVKKEILSYTANMGGTSIFEPLSYVINELMPGIEYEK